MINYYNTSVKTNILNGYNNKKNNGNNALNNENKKSRHVRIRAKIDLQQLNNNNKTKTIIHNELKPISHRRL